MRVRRQRIALMGGPDCGRVVIALFDGGIPTAHILCNDEQYTIVGESAMNHTLLYAHSTLNLLSLWETEE